MSCEKIVLLDGTPAGVDSLGGAFAIVREVLQETDSVVTIFSLREIRMAHCIGCFGCWLETPGICIQSDAGRRIAETLIGSDMVILFTPVTFGGYSSTLKKPLDRLLPLTLPFFCRKDGQTRHKQRYENYPRLVTIGVQSCRDAAEAGFFKTLAGRNAMNCHAPSFAADVVVESDPPDLQRELILSLITRQDVPTSGGGAASTMPEPEPISHRTGGAVGRALLIIGSPKIKSSSTSEVLGTYLLERLTEQGWQTDSLTLNAGLLQEEGRAGFLAAADRADLLILAFPLYLDCLPFLAMHALETLAGHRSGRPHSPAQRFMALCNCGFPETRNCASALAICRQFALRCKMTWAGSLALGAGPALSDGDPLSECGSSRRPPTKHVMAGLDLAAKALTEGLPVPKQAQELFEKSPIPLIPFSLWSWLIPKIGQSRLRLKAAQNGVASHAMLKRPYRNY